MLHKLMKIILTLGIFSLGLLSLPHSAKAAGANFTVERIASNQQNDPTVSYFDLKLKPNQTTEVKVKVTNLSNN
ncbi:WxL protein peptidoglycan domain-containing protein, partial [Pediococcus ethanolidurans]